MQENETSCTYICKNNDDIPYPDVEGIVADCCALRIIAPAYAGEDGELTGVLQYTYQHLIFEKLGYEKYAKALEKISIDEMRHFELLGKTVLRLGALPIYTALPPCPVNFYTSKKVARDSSPIKMILDDIHAEQNAIIAYTKMIEQLKDEKIGAIIQRIRMDEEEHLCIFKQIYRELTEKERL